MGMVVWKQPLDIKPVCELVVPVGAVFLTAREQNDQICVWYLCNPALARETRTLRVLGTGNGSLDFNEPAKRYLGTAMLHGGTSVWHVFELDDNG